ncbi:initiator tRNA phosphoribosyl transferase [Irpex lacteus]|nr:initiator tRNA phosphoribosyl transferase [Irpex lacteus]
MDLLDSAESYHAQALVELRRESLDLFNRLHSIAEDIEFVSSVHDSYEDVPIIPNLRCGAWYVNPSAITEQPAYFKSTDGHFNNWSFNLRRPNIHLLKTIECRKGLILVDSTRAGKRMPDALSKTVPLWCAVINHAVKFKYRIQDVDWDTSLYTPPGVISAQEHNQIEGKLQEWAVRLLHSTYEIPNLERPLRPLWITPASASWPQLPPVDQQRFYPVICVSASRQVNEGLERRTHGFAYVQGSGDDHELWGQGLEPSVFWKCKDRLLQADRPGLSNLVAQLVSMESSNAKRDYSSNSPSPIARVQGRVMIGLSSDLSANFATPSTSASCRTAYVAISGDATAQPQQASAAMTTDSTKISEAGTDTPESEEIATILTLHLLPGKRGQHQFLKSVLPQSLQFIDIQLARDSTSAICICCDTGKDASVGVALAALQLFFDDEGVYIPDSERAGRRPKPDKNSISKRLQWIITSRPQANPSRATLKRVNEYLMTPVTFRASSEVGQQVQGE